MDPLPSHPRQRGYKAVRVTLAVACACAPLMLAPACGIPSIGFLSPPEISAASPDLATVTFAHPPANNLDSFAGYDFFYKFYLPSLALTQYNEDQDALAAASPGLVDQVLRQRGFNRMVPASAAVDSQRPLMRVSRAAAASVFEFVLQFPPSSFDETPGSVQWPVADPQNAVQLGRPQGSDATATVKPFLPDQIDSADVDVPDGLASDEGNTVRLGIAAVAYGIDYSANLAPITSKPVLPSEPLVLPYLWE